MSGMWGKMSLNQRLGAVAILLGAVAVFGKPQVGPVSRVDSRELARIVETDMAQVTPDELAGWIVEGRADYRLIDLRGDEAFARYHIPTAEPVAVTELMGAGLARNETVVLLSEDGTQSAQAWFLMRAQGYRSVYMVAGGVSAWRNQVLFPVAPSEDADAETQASFDRKVRVSTFFGGQPRAAATGGQPMGGLTIPEVAMPEVAMPSVDASASPAAAPRRKKAREGC